MQPRPATTATPAKGGTPSGAARTPLFVRVGGRPTLERVHTMLYDRVYRDRVMSQFFRNVKRDRQEQQLTDFMSGAMGGPTPYVGKHPRDAHTHIFITEELFDSRHLMLTDALRQAGVAPDLAEEWLRIDRAFKRILVKASIAECRPRYTGEAILSAQTT